jgi:hypothetical protein
VSHSCCFEGECFCPSIHKDPIPEPPHLGEIFFPSKETRRKKKERKQRQKQLKKEEKQRKQEIEKQRQQEEVARGSKR